MFVAKRSKPKTCLLRRSNNSTYWKSFEKTNFDLYLQNGFQETDVIKSTSHFTKYAKAVDHCSQVVPSVREAFKSMLTGRPGPAVLDITMDAQTDKMENPTSEDLDYYNFKQTLLEGLLSVDKPSSKKDYNFSDKLDSSVDI